MVLYEKCKQTKASEISPIGCAPFCQLLGWPVRVFANTRTCCDLWEWGRERERLEEREKVPSSQWSSRLDRITHTHTQTFFECFCIQSCHNREPRKYLNWSINLLQEKNLFTRKLVRQKRTNALIVTSSLTFRPTIIPCTKLHRSSFVVPVVLLTPPPPPPLLLVNTL